MSTIETICILNIVAKDEIAFSSKIVSHTLQILVTMNKKTSAGNNENEWLSSRITDQPESHL